MRSFPSIDEREHAAETRTHLQKASFRVGGLQCGSTSITRTAWCGGIDDSTFKSCADVRNSNLSVKKGGGKDKGTAVDRVEA